MSTRNPEKWKIATAGATVCCKYELGWSDIDIQARKGEDLCFEIRERAPDGFHSCFFIPDAILERLGYVRRAQEEESDA